MKVYFSQKLVLGLLTAFVLSEGCTERGSGDSGKPWDPQNADILYKPAPAEVKTRWVSPENPSGEKGRGGTTNQGAKGNAFYIVQPGQSKTLLDVKGPGIINRMWLSGTIGVNMEQRRAVRIDMYWDGALKPAVSAPVGDFFGIGLGASARYDNALLAHGKNHCRQIFRGAGASTKSLPGPVATGTTLMCK